MHDRKPGIVLLGPPDPYAGFYRNMLEAAAAGFAAHGYPVAFRNGPLHQETVIDFARANDVGLVLDINRMVREAGPWPDSLIYIPWIQDYDREVREKGSFQTCAGRGYFLADPARYGISLPEGCEWSFLAPAAHPAAQSGGYRGASRSGLSGDISFARDFCLAGSILPPPVNGNVAKSGDGKDVTLTEFSRYWPKKLFSRAAFSRASLDRHVDLIHEKTGWELTPHGRELFYGEFLRIYDRKIMIDMSAKMSSNIEIFGSPAWLAWKEYASFYKGSVTDPALLDEIYRTSRINLHDGSSPFHPRVMNCMAAGGFMLVLTAGGGGAAPEGMQACLQEDVHFASCTLETFPEVAGRYLGDEAARHSIARAGEAFVNAHHTWISRAAGILDDIGLGTSPDAVWTPDCVPDARLQKALHDAAVKEIAPRRPCGGPGRRVPGDAGALPDVKAAPEASPAGGNGVRIRRELADDYHVFMITAHGYAGDHYFGWLPKALNTHPEMFALLAHEGSRPKYLKERTRSERPPLDLFVEFLNDMGMTFQAIGDCYSYRAPQMSGLLSDSRYRNIPVLNLVRHPLVWMEFYTRWRATNMRMRAEGTDPLEWEWKIVPHARYASMGLREYGREDVGIWAAFKAMSTLNNVIRDVRTPCLHLPMERLVHDRSCFRQTVDYLTRGRCSFDDNLLDTAYSMLPDLFRGEEPVAAGPEAILATWPDWKFDAFRKIVDPYALSVFEGFGYDLRDVVKKSAVAGRSGSRPALPGPAHPPAPANSLPASAPVTASRPPLFMSSIMKSGTWFLREIVGQITGLEWVEPDIGSGMPTQYDNELYIVIPPGKFFSWHSGITEKTASLLNSMGSKNIFLIRHPVDTVVSMANHFLFDVDASTGRSVGNTEFLQKYSKDALLSMMINGFSFEKLNWEGVFPHIRQLKSFVDFVRSGNDALLIRYEDLVENPDAWIAHIARYLGIGLAPEDIHRIAALTRFDSMKEKAEQQGRGMHFMRAPGRCLRSDFGEHHLAMLQAEIRRTDPAMMRHLAAMGYAGAGPYRASSP